MKLRDAALVCLVGCLFDMTSTMIAFHLFGPYDLGAMCIPGMIDQNAIINGLVARFGVWSIALYLPVEFAEFTAPMALFRRYVDPIVSPVVSTLPTYFLLAVVLLIPYSGALHNAGVILSRL